MALSTGGNTTNSLPIGWGTTVGLTSQPVLPANPTRTGLIFINSGTVAVAICPANVNIGALGVYPPVPAGGAPPVGVAVINGAGSITMQPGDKFIFDNLPCGCGWNGIGAQPGAVLTILEHG
jgi:hypothetical protein